jgi:hypothetical protein
MKEIGKIETQNIYTIIKCIICENLHIMHIYEFLTIIFLK